MLASDKIAHAPRRTKSPPVLLSSVLFIGFVYSLLPTESQNAGYSLNVYLRGFVAAVICVVVVIRFKPRISRASALYLSLLFVVSLLAAASSFSSYMYLFWMSVVFGVTLATAAAQDELFRVALSRAVLALILLSVVALAFQIAFYVLSGVSIDLHQMIYPFSEARIPDQGTFLRFGGIYIEPGTHAQWIYLLLLVYISLNPGSKPLLSTVVAASMLFTASTWGVGVAILLTMAGFVQAKRQEKIVIAIVVSAVVLVSVPMIPTADVLEFFEWKVSFETEAPGTKNDTYQQFYKRVGEVAFIGLGFLPDFCRNCFVVQDAGLALNLAVTMGLAFSVGTFFLFFFSIFRAGEVGFALMCIPFLFTKAFFWDFLVWLLFFVVVVRRMAKSTPNRLPRSLRRAMKWPIKEGGLSA